MHSDYIVPFFFLLYCLALPRDTFYQYILESKGDLTNNKSVSNSFIISMNYSHLIEKRSNIKLLVFNGRIDLFSKVSCLKKKLWQNYHYQLRSCLNQIRGIVTSVDIHIRNFILFLLSLMGIYL